MTVRPTPPADVAVDEALVRGLLREQMPDLAGLDLELVASGWDNAVYRLGSDLCVRLPRREMAAGLVEHEQRWLPGLAPTLPLPVPAPVRFGRPGAGYPWCWSVVPWLPGRPWTDGPPDDLTAAATALGRFLAALHRPAPEDAPVNPYRGVPLRARDHSFRDLVGTVPGFRAPDLLASWEEAVAVPDWDGPPVLLHGDMHAANLLVSADGRLAGVIDFGDMCGGDPATDLVPAWMLFDDHDRAAFRAALGSVDDGTWARGRGWALSFGVVLLAHSRGHPGFARYGRAAIDRATGGGARA